MKLQDNTAVQDLLAQLRRDDEGFQHLTERGDLIEGQVKAYLIEAGEDDSLVELPGVAFGALRGRVANSLLREAGE